MQNLYPYLTRAGKRFLIYYESQHLMCCRTVRDMGGNISVIVMDSCAAHATGKGLLQVLQLCKSIPSVLRRAIIDDGCGQETGGLERGVLMSIGNLGLQDAESVNAAEGDGVGREFIMLNPDIGQAGSSQLASTEMQDQIQHSWIKGLRDLALY
jgi:hypothetical protein